MSRFLVYDFEARERVTERASIPEVIVFLLNRLALEDMPEVRRQLVARDRELSGVAHPIPRLQGCTDWSLDYGGEGG